MESKIETDGVFDGKFVRRLDGTWKRVHAEDELEQMVFRADSELRSLCGELYEAALSFATLESEGGSAFVGKDDWKVLEPLRDKCASLGIPAKTPNVMADRGRGIGDG